MIINENTKLGLTIGTWATLTVVIVCGAIRLFVDEQDIRQNTARLKSLERYCKAKFQIEGPELSKNYLATHPWYDE